MLDKQVETWESYPYELRRRMSIVLVDDGSPNDPAYPHVSETTLPIQLFRITKNIPWNQNGAHNLGMHVADEGWCLVTDIDHVLTPDNLAYIFELAVNPKKYYRFGRRQVGRLSTPYKPHPNTWLLTRHLFWWAGGYDEDFSGFYGSDSCFKRALQSVAVGEELDPPYMVVYDENDIPDANTREFGRKDSEYYSVRYPRLRKKRGMVYKAENPLRFPWERQI